LSEITIKELYFSLVVETLTLYTGYFDFQGSSL